MTSDKSRLPVPIPWDIPEPAWWTRQDSSCIPVPVEPMMPIRAASDCVCKPNPGSAQIRRTAIRAHYDEPFFLRFDFERKLILNGYVAGEKEDIQALIEGQARLASGVFPRDGNHRHAAIRPQRDSLRQGSRLGRSRVFPRGA